jgi:hypothetical protein
MKIWGEADKHKQKPITTFAPANVDPLLAWHSHVAAPDHTLEPALTFARPA